jgi:hypothetical protein
LGFSEKYIKDGISRFVMCQETAINWQVAFNAAQAALFFQSLKFYFSTLKFTVDI